MTEADDIQSVEVKDFTKGEKIFLKHCSVCHQKNGEGIREHSFSQGKRG